MGGSGDDVDLVPSHADDKIIGTPKNPYTGDTVNKPIEPPSIILNTYLSAI